MTRRPDIDTADLIRMYRSGMSTLKIAAEVGVSDAAVANRLKNAGVTMRGNVRGDVSAKEVADLYRSGYSLDRIALELGMSRPTARKKLREAGVPTAQQLKSAVTTEQLARLYQSGMSCAEVAIEVGVLSEDGVYQRLRRSGRYIRSRGAGVTAASYLAATAEDFA